jgi:hypothetical protein
MEHAKNKFATPVQQNQVKKIQKCSTHPLYSGLSQVYGNDNYR